MISIKHSDHNYDHFPLALGVPFAEPEASAKTQLLDLMSEYVNEKVVVADQVLVGHAVSKVYDGDVILTYAFSQVRESVFVFESRGGGG